MTSRQPPPVQEREPGADEEEEGLDLQQIRDQLGFVLRAPKRHRALAGVVFVLTAAVGIALAVTIPRTYEASVKLLAQRNLVVPALTNPNRALRQDSDSPTHNVSNLILRRENLASLCTELDLTNRYYASRSPALKLKDSVLGGSGSEADKTYTVVATLEKRLTVQTDDSTVTIAVDWSDPQQAYDIVSHVQENFLDARYDDEVAMIGDALSVLQGHAKTERDHLDTALEEYQKLLADESPKAPPPRAVAPGVTYVRPAGGGAASPSPSGLPAAPDPELKATLDDTRRQIKTLEDERQQELASLRQQLTQAELTLTPQHPTVIALQQQIESRSQTSPDLIRLRNQERTLVAQMTPAPNPNGASPAAPRPIPALPNGAGGTAAPPLPPIPALPIGWESDGRAQLARSKLDAAIKSYQEVVDRIDAANIELEIARTAFKYRFSVVTPAEIPKRTKKPVALLVGIASLPAALLLAILFAAAADAWRGRVLEPWQVRRKLKLEVLGELE